MRNIRELCVSILCEIGKYGVRKSLTLGIFEFSVPDELKETLMNDSVQGRNSPSLSDSTAASA